MILSFKNNAEDIGNTVEKTPSLWKLFLETVLPRDFWGFAAILVILTSGLSYWLISFYTYPDTPLSVHALYRGGDIQYYPLVTSLSRLELREYLLLEEEGTGIRSRPIPDSILHACLFMAAGPGAFIIADLIIIWVYFVTLVILLRLFRIPGSWAKCLGMIIISGLPLRVNQLLGGLCGPARQIFWFWQLRLMRPFVSELVVLVVLICLIMFLYSRNSVRRTSLWFLLGLSMGLLTQVELHLSFTFWIFLPFFWIYLIKRNQLPLKIVIKELMAFAVPAVVVLLPFVLQRLFEHPDFPIRQGVFTVERFDPPFTLKFLRPTATSLFLLTALLVNTFSPQSPFDRSLKTKALLVLGYLCLISLFALPLSCFIFGKTAIQGSFWSAFARFTSFLSLVCGVYIIRGLSKMFFSRLPHRPWIKSIRTQGRGMVMTAIFAASLWSGINRGSIKAHFTGPKGYSYYFDDIILPFSGYRKNFTTLVEELSRPKYNDCKVIGTFDHQTFIWWVSFKGGYSFLADPLLTTVPDSEIERRLILFCRLLGVSEKDFIPMIERWWTNYCWLGSVKYNATRAYTYAPLNEYSEGVRERIASFNLWRTFNLILPQSVKDRLSEEYLLLTERSSRPRLDLVVLVKNDPYQSSLTPDTRFFAPTYENSVFRVWKHQPL